MTGVELHFLTGKWHATPWGRQVNEGAVEWPPSPWRFLRALIAVWHHKAEDVPANEMDQLIESLTSPPLFQLPVASQGHTRHYMPVANDKRTKVFDTFITVPPKEPVVMYWQDVTLDEAQRRLLARLLRDMSYFGRAESWVEASLIDDIDGEPNAMPFDMARTDGSYELVRLLAPVDGAEYTIWRTGMLDELKSRRLLQKQEQAKQKGKSPEKEKLTKADLSKVHAALPETLFDALHAETGDLRDAGWNLPPGSQWVDYVRDRDAFDSHRNAPRRPKTRCPTVARFAIAGAVRPRFTEALPIGESARRVLMGCSKRERTSNTASEVFSGKNSDGSPRNDRHRHAHFLCEANDPKRGSITHLTVYAQMGFCIDEERAFSRFTRLKDRKGRRSYDLQLVLLGIGHPEDFGGINTKAGQSPILHTSRVWVSRTPFVPTRHLHIRGVGSSDARNRETVMLEELKRAAQLEIERRPELQLYAESVKITPLLDRDDCGTHLDGGRLTSWLKFRRERLLGNGRKAGTQAFGFRLEFPEPVRGPIVLGYGCHFGLGQFWPEEMIH